MSWRGGAWSPRRSSFAFRIDYDQAIADDEARIAWAKRSIERGWYRRSWPYIDHPELGTYDATELHQLVLYCEDVATSAGFSAQDVADLADSLDLLDSALRYRPSLPEPGMASGRRGSELAARIEELSLGGQWLHASEDDARAALRKARASRARHLRNREKYGPRRATTT